MFRKIQLTYFKKVTARSIVVLFSFMPLISLAQTPPTYNVSGAINGARGSVQIVDIQTGKSAAVSASRPGFSLKDYLAGQSYNLTLTAPAYQTCNFAGTAKSGTIGSSHVGGILINCTDNAYTLSGTVNFPESIQADGVVIADSKGNSVPVSLSSPDFSLPGYVYDERYSVKIFKAPPHLNCSPISGISGTVKGSIANLIFKCTENIYEVDVTVRSLEDKLVITNKDLGVDKTATRDKPTVKFKGYIHGQVPKLVIPKDVTRNGVKEDNQQYQVCKFETSTVGAVNNGNFIHPEIICKDKEFYISGQARNLKGDLRITDDEKNDRIGITLNQSKTEYKFENKGFTYPNSFALKVLQQPEHQRCTFDRISGDFRAGQGTGYTNGNIVNNQITCIDNLYSLLGTVKGYTSTGLVLEDGKTTINISKSKLSFAFDKYKYKADDNYEVTINTQPKDQKCRVLNGKGVVKGETSGIKVECQDDLAAAGFDAGIDGRGRLVNVPLKVASKSPSQEICEGTIEWGDGVIDHIKKCGSEFSFKHQYNAEKDYLIRVKVTKPSSIAGETTLNVPVRKSKQCVVPGPNGTTIDGFMDGFEAVIP